MHLGSAHKPFDFKTTLQTRACVCVGLRVRLRACRMWRPQKQQLWSGSPFSFCTPSICLGATKAPFGAEHIHLENESDCARHAVGRMQMRNELITPARLPCLHFPRLFRADCMQARLVSKRKKRNTSFVIENTTATATNRLVAGLLPFTETPPVDSLTF